MQNHDLLLIAVSLGLIIRDGLEVSPEDFAERVNDYTDAVRDEYTRRIEKRMRKTVEDIRRSTKRG